MATHTVCKWSKVIVETLLIFYCISIFAVHGRPQKEQEDGQPRPPMIAEADNQRFNHLEGEEVRVRCTVTGVPRPNIEWIKTDNKNLAELGIRIEKSHRSTMDQIIETFVIPKFNNSIHKGSYKCIATNSENQQNEIEFRISSKDARNGEPTTEEPPTANHGATASVVVVVVVITLLGVAVWSELLRRKNRHGLSKRDVELFHKGNPEAQKKGYAHENAMYQPYDFSYELNEDKLKIDKDDILGAGVFGQVVRAKYDGSTVAVKMVKPGAEKSYLKALLTELKIMIYIGRHPYISELIGATSKDLRRGMLNVVVTLYPLGNVESYLRGRRYMFVNLFDESGNLTRNAGDSDLCTMDLIRWSYQVAEGMEYLGNRNIIHGDLAARNILLDANKTAKITDFGLARKMYDYANYVKRHQEPLPWRWMAVESLKELSFSPKSDTWSYGVLLWEFFTCGDVPYPGYSWTTDFVDKLMEGLRLPRPKYASKELYRGIMDNCWQIKPENRIAFATISLYLKEFLKDSDLLDNTTAVTAL